METQVKLFFDVCHCFFSFIHFAFAFTCGSMRMESQQFQIEDLSWGDFLLFASGVMCVGTQKKIDKCQRKYRFRIRTG